MNNRLLVGAAIAGAMVLAMSQNAEAGGFVYSQSCAPVYTYVPAPVYGPAYVYEPVPVYGGFYGPPRAYFHGHFGHHHHHHFHGHHHGGFGLHIGGDNFHIDLHH